MRGSRAVSMLILSVLLTGCGDPAGPLAPLQLDLSVSALSPLVGDRSDVTIVLRNGGTDPVTFGAAGTCVVGFDLEREGGWDDEVRRALPLIEPDPRSLGASVSCHLEAGAWTVPPRDVMAFHVQWRAFTSGVYTLRPYVATDEGDRRGPSVSVTVQAGANARLIHTHPDLPAVDVVVRGRVRVPAVAPGQVSSAGIVPTGIQQVELRSAEDGALLGSTAVTFTEGTPHTLVIRAGPGGPGLWDVADTTAVDSGKSALRVVHLALRAPPVAVSVGVAGTLEPVPFAVPFPYGMASPYIVRSADPWQVLVTDVAGADTLLFLGAMPIAEKERRLLLLVDGTNGGISPYLIDPDYRDYRLVEGEPH